MTTTEMVLPTNLVEDTYTVRLTLSVIFWLTFGLLDASRDEVMF